MPRELSRRDLLRAGVVAGSMAALWPGTRALASLPGASPSRSNLRLPDSLPDPSRPMGTADPSMPFDHVICWMMENHSFDNYFGMLSQRGQPKADGFRFDRAGRPTNANYDKTGRKVRAFDLAQGCAGGGVSQNWDVTHRSVNGGRMDGFVTAKGDDQPMAYWDQDTLGFYYSFANTFTLANRWFCSAPCQTYPNRRFLMAGTAFGNISTDTSTIIDTAPPFIAAPPPNGTIFDRLSVAGISWKNYFTDLPATGIIPTIIEKYPQHIVPIAQFFADCAAGTLPAVSFVDPEFGALGEVGGPISQVPAVGKIPGVLLNTTGGSEENPQDIKYGQATSERVVTAVLNSPLWRKVMFVYTYDEHGGYYDHVPPPRALRPDDIPPALGPSNVPGAYDVYGPRVPAVVMSAYSKPHDVTDVVHDHTSVLAT
ncbi:MAG TPA: alkaline phosphatase family protein, partial [Acidimicrobiales bacterium]